MPNSISNLEPRSARLLRLPGLVHALMDACVQSKLSWASTPQSLRYDETQNPEGEVEAAEHISLMQEFGHRLRFCEKDLLQCSC